MKKTIMKDIRLMAALLMAGGMMVACSSDGDDMAQPAAPKVYNVTVDGAQRGGDEMRAALSLSDENNITASWQTTDKVWVKQISGGVGTQANGTLSPTAAGASATLSGKLSGVEFIKNKSLLLYTYDPSTTSYESFNGQKGTLADIGSKFDFCSAAGTVSDVDASGNLTIGLTGKFKPIYAIVQFALYDKESNDELNAKQLTVKIGSLCEIDVEPTAATCLLYVAVPGMEDAETITLTAKVGSDTYTCTASDKKFMDCKYYYVNAMMTKQ